MDLVGTWHRKDWAEFSDTVCNSGTEMWGAPVIRMETTPAPCGFFEGLGSGANGWTWAVRSGLATDRRRAARTNSCPEQRLRPAPKRGFHGVGRRHREPGPMTKEILVW